MNKKSASSAEVNPQDFHDAPDLAGFVEYWRSKCTPGDIPNRIDIVPTELKHDLGSLFIAEPLDNESDFRFRLVGADLTTVFRREFTGMTISMLSPPLQPDAMANILNVYQIVVRKRAVVRARGNISWASCDYLTFDSVHVPIRSPDASATWLLGKMVVLYSKESTSIPTSLQRHHPIGGAVANLPAQNSIQKDQFSLRQELSAR